jgi:hypothetical protein
LLAPGEVAADIDRAGGRWLVLAAKIARPTAQTIDTWGPHPWTIPGKTVRVLAATRDDLSDLEAIGEFPLGEPLWAMRLQGQSDAVTGQVTPSAYWVSAVADLHRLDLKTWQWSVAKQPGHRFDSLRFSTDGSLMTVFRQQGAFSKVSLSRDEGASWVPYSRPPYTLYDVVLDTPDSGMATRLNAEAFTTVIEFYEYDPKLKDWRKSHETPKGCVRLLRDAAYRQRFCLTSGGSILDYRNGQWQVEFALE